MAVFTGGGKRKKTVWSAWEKELIRLHDLVGFPFLAISGDKINMNNLIVRIAIIPFSKSNWR